MPYRAQRSASRCDSWRSGSSRRDSVSVHSGIDDGNGDAVRLAGLAQEVGIERGVVGDEMGVAEPSRRIRSAPRGRAARARTICRRIPWIPTGPTRNHQRRRGATRLDQRSSTRPLPSTMTRPTCKHVDGDATTAPTSRRRRRRTAWRRAPHPCTQPYAGGVTRPQPGQGTEAELQQLGGEAGDGAALARRQGDVPEAALTAERLDQHGQRVVRLAHVRARRSGWCRR